MKGRSKLIGGFLGFLLAGPGGTLFGLLIGHLFDKNRSLFKSNAWDDRQGASSDMPKAPGFCHSDQLNLQKAYRTLGLTDQATLVEVKHAYRRFMSRYHPDRLSQQNLASGELKQALHKSQAIQQSYELIYKTQYPLPSTS